MAARIVPELTSLVTKNQSPHSAQFNPVDCANDILNFYNNFNSDLLMYQIVRWFGEGGKYRCSGENNAFQLYPSIGQLAAISISKLRLLNLDETVASYFINAHTNRLLLKIDMLFGIYCAHVTAESEAHKKLHKFCMLDSVAKAIKQMGVADPYGQLFNDLTEKAEKQIQECLAIKEPIKPQLRLTAM
jgi:hypothetical protein